MEEHYGASATCCYTGVQARRRPSARRAPQCLRRQPGAAVVGALNGAGQVVAPSTTSILRWGNGSRKLDRRTRAEPRRGSPRPVRDGNGGGLAAADCELAVATIDGCNAAGIFALRDGQVVTAASSHPIVELDEQQFANNEGPCLDAVDGRRMAHANDLADDDHWPSFGAMAARAGTRSALAVRLSDRPISALNLYARLPGAFGATDAPKRSSSQPWPATPPTPPRNE